MIEEHDNDESKTESELKPEERMPDVTIATETNNEWVRDIDYEKILARVDRFQGKTVVVKFNWPQYSIHSSTFSLLHLVTVHHYGYVA